MSSCAEPYYRRDLALVHHLAFGGHADACAPGGLALLEQVRLSGGIGLERNDDGSWRRDDPRFGRAQGHRVTASAPGSPG